MATVLFIDGENFKGKIRSVFKETRSNKPVWHQYDFKGLFDKVLAGIPITKKVFYSDLQPAIQEARLRGTKCLYLGFETQPNKGISYTTSRTILIRNSEVMEFENDTSVTQKPKFFDAHTHVQFSAYQADRAAVLARAREAGVWMINVGTQRDTSRAAVELAENAAGIFAAVGLHPVHTGKSFHDAQELGGGDAAKGFTSRGEVFDAEYYRKLAAHPKTVAIGECGLDYFHFSDDEPREEQVRKQKAAFIAQIELSLEIKKPLMIHCRNAFADLIEVLKNYENKFKDLAAQGGSPGIIHFFTGTPDDAREFLNLGFSFTFGGAITFPPRKGKNGAAAPTTGDYDEVVKLIPLNRILSETDAPYLAPAQYRGKRNEPAYIPETVKKLAELKNISPEEMKVQIWENARWVFALSLY